MTTIAYQNFIDDVRNDLKEFIQYRWTEKEIKELDRDEVYDEAFTADSVTGNGSGSYFFNAWKAKEAIFNMDEDLLKETISEFGIDMAEHWGDWEFLDVSVRCYAIGIIDIDELLEEIREEIGTEDKIIYFLRSYIKGILDGLKAFETFDLYFYKDGEITTAKRLNEDFLCEWHGRLDKNANELIQDIIDSITYDHENICFD